MKRIVKPSAKRGKMIKWGKTVTSHTGTSKKKPGTSKTVTLKITSKMVTSKKWLVTYLTKYLIVKKTWS